MAADTEDNIFPDPNYPKNNDDYRNLSPCEDPNVCTNAKARAAVKNISAPEITTFIQAAITGDIKKLEELIKANKYIVHVKLKSKPALFYACLAQQHQAVDLLIKSGASIHEKSLNDPDTYRDVSYGMNNLNEGRTKFEAFLKSENFLNYLTDKAFAKRMSQAYEIVAKHLDQQHNKAHIKFFTHTGKICGATGAGMQSSKILTRPTSTLPQISSHAEHPNHKGVYQIYDITPAPNTPFRIVFQANNLLSDQPGVLRIGIKFAPYFVYLIAEIQKPAGYDFFIGAYNDQVMTLASQKKEHVPGASQDPYYLEVGMFKIPKDYHPSHNPSQIFDTQFRKHVGDKKMDSETNMQFNGWESDDIVLKKCDEIHFARVTLPPESFSRKEPSKPKVETKVAADVPAAPNANAQVAPAKHVTPDHKQASQAVQAPQAAQALTFSNAAQAVTSPSTPTPAKKAEATPKKKKKGKKKKGKKNP